MKNFSFIMACLLLIGVNTYAQEANGTFLEIKKELSQLKADNKLEVLKFVINSKKQKKGTIYDSSDWDYFEAKGKFVNFYDGYGNFEERHPLSAVKIDHYKYATIPARLVDKANLVFEAPDGKRVVIMRVENKNISFEGYMVKDSYLRAKFLYLAKVDDGEMNDGKMIAKKCAFICDSEEGTLSTRLYHWGESKTLSDQGKIDGQLVINCDLGEAPSDGVSLYFVPSKMAVYYNRKFYTFKEVILR